MLTNNFRKNTGSILLTILVVSLLLASGPASAIDIGLKNLAGSHKQGEDISFSVTVGINKDKTGELLPVKYTNITITNPDGSLSICKINNDKTVKGCDFLNVSDITKSSGLDYGYGYGYGYDSNAVRQDLGYGYGYGYGSTSGNITYSLVLHTNGMKGEYSAKAVVYAGTADTPFTSSTVSFNVWAASAAGNATATVSPNSTAPATVDAHSAADANIIISTNASVSGSVTVSKYTENIANSTSGVSQSFKAAGKYIDIVVDSSIKDALSGATIKIYYTNAELASAGISESSLAVYYYNPATGAWENMGGVLGSDSNGKYISVVVNHFSLYGLFGSAAPVSSSSYGPGTGEINLNQVVVITPSNRTTPALPKEILLSNATSNEAMPSVSSIMQDAANAIAQASGVTSDYAKSLLGQAKAAYEAKDYALALNLARRAVAATTDVSPAAATPAPTGFATSAAARNAATVAAVLAILAAAYYLWARYGGKKKR